MKRVLLPIMICLLFLGITPAFAQQEIVFDFVQVQLWPEYDRPSMLVIHSYQLPEDQPLPVEVSIRIPAEVGEPSAVAVAEDGGLFTREYTRTVEGDWATITLQADTPVVLIEYYDPSLSQEDNPRTFTYTWLGDYATQELNISIQQPVGATQMSTSPNYGSGSTGSDGLTYYSQTYGPLAAGEETSVSLTYQKDDTALSLTSAATTTQDTSNVALQGLPVWGWVLIGVGTVVVVGGAVFFILSGRQEKPASTYQQKKQRASTAAPRAGKSATFCHQCGTQAAPGDKFCRECGTALRV